MGVRGIFPKLYIYWLQYQRCLLLSIYLFLGGSVVVDLTNDSGFHDSNVVDLTSESPADSSIDSSPVIVV